jgi:hemoglobin-like flavoprotein
MADGSAGIEDVSWQPVQLLLGVAGGRKKTWAEHWKLHHALTLFNPAAVARRVIARPGSGRRRRCPSMGLRSAKPMAWNEPCTGRPCTRALRLLVGPGADIRVATVRVDLGEASARCSGGCQPEAGHHIAHCARLFLQAFRGRGRLLHQHRVLLRHLVELIDRRVPIADCQDTGLDGDAVDAADVGADAPWTGADPIQGRHHLHERCGRPWRPGGDTPQPHEPAPMTDCILERSLHVVVDRIGDPAPRVFERLFAGSPELQSLFCNDRSGTVRAEMFLRALECLVDAAGAQRFAAGLIEAEKITHLSYGVSPTQFQHFFTLMVDVIRDAMGPDWTAELSSAWGEALLRTQRAIAPTESDGATDPVRTPPRSGDDC